MKIDLLKRSETVELVKFSLIPYNLKSMLNYSLFKLIHLTAISIAVSELAVSFYLDDPPKHVKVLGAIASVLVIVSGLSMVYAGGLAHGSGLPLWIKGKMTVWLLLIMLGPLFTKKLSRLRIPSFYILLSGGVVSALFAILRPI